MDGATGLAPPDSPINDNTPGVWANEEHDRVDLKTLSERDRVTYVADAARRAGFTSLSDVFIAQLRNFPLLQEDGLRVVLSAMCNPELGHLQIFLRKDKDVCLYGK